MMTKREDDDRAGVHDHLQHGHELRVERDEEDRQQEERRDQAERTVHRFATATTLVAAVTVRTASTRKNRAHAPSTRSTTSAETRTFSRASGSRPCQPSRMSWS